MLDGLGAKFGMKFGRLECSLHEHVVYNAVAKSISKNIGQVTLKGLGKITASKPKRRGEFEFNDSIAAAEFMTMPRLVKNIEQMVRNILESTNKPKNADYDG